MSKIPMYSVIIPTYNERENVGIVVELLYETFCKLNVNWEIIIVDDSSPDGTASVVEKLQECYPEVKLELVKRTGKLGLGTAYMKGFEHSSGDFIILMDCDLSHHPKYISDFIEKQKSQNFDIVSGSRYMKNGGVSGWTWNRILVTQFLLQPRASDLTGSFRLYKREVFESILGSNMVSKGYVFQMEIIARATRFGYSIADVPIVFVDRLYGDSKLGKNEIFGYIKGLLQLFWIL
ncbi:dolichol-phosphate-mannose synthase family protein [Cryptosporidium felis]|nr:dolichol-phosphate-mannose synthase family protein [Cryptosporidium felis]